jgi:hypothetical protein
MIQRRLFVEKLRELGFGYLDQKDKVEIYQRPGDIRCPNVRRKDSIADGKGVEELGKSALAEPRPAAIEFVPRPQSEKGCIMNMKKLLLAVLLFNLAGAAAGRAQGNSSGPLVWCGLDYSKVKMIGTQDFRQPDQIFPGMLATWNSLFMKEMSPRLERMDHSVESDLDAVTARNEKASESQIEHTDGMGDEMVKPSHITEADIAEAVRGYKLKHDQGLGLVFIMDRLVKAQETGCLYVVFFDISSRKVLSSERLCEKAGGIGFRNYWFRPIKAAVDRLPKMYKNLGPKK